MPSEMKEGSFEAPLFFFRHKQHLNHTILLLLSVTIQLQFADSQYTCTPEIIAGNSKLRDLVSFIFSRIIV